MAKHELVDIVDLEGIDKDLEKLRFLTLRKFCDVLGDVAVEATEKDVSIEFYNVIDILNRKVNQSLAERQREINNQLKRKDHAKNE